MEWPRQLLFSCTTQDTREVFASLVVSVIAGLIEAGERGLYGEVEELDEVDMEELDEEGEVIVHQDERKRQVCFYYSLLLPSLVNPFLYRSRGTKCTCMASLVHLWFVL
jgi:hypothetical protein